MAKREFTLLSSHKWTEKKSFFFSLTFSNTSILFHFWCNNRLTDAFRSFSLSFCFFSLPFLHFVGFEIETKNETRINQTNLNRTQLLNTKYNHKKNLFNFIEYSSELIQCRWRRNKETVRHFRLCAIKQERRKQNNIWKPHSSTVLVDSIAWLSIFFSFSFDSTVVHNDTHRENGFNERRENERANQVCCTQTCRRFCDG